MDIKNSRKVSILDRYWGPVKNGLFFFGLRNRLAGIGIDFNPYYWVQEEFEPCETPIVKGDSSKYNLKYLSLDEVKLVSHPDSAKYFEQKLISDKNGISCIGLENHGEIAAYMYAEFNDFIFKGRAFRLKANEAYLLNMWTFHDFRGRNLAPYLRYQAYQLLKEQGRDVKYSISDSFNKSSIKFKKKLNTKEVYLYLSIVLFKRFEWNFTLKKY